MKKKFLRALALALVSLLALGALAACDNGQDSSEDDGDGQSESTYAIKYNGTTAELGKKADGVLKKLGEPASKQNTGNCGGLGETTRYDYSSFVLVVVDYEDGDKIIDTIELKNDGAETAKGIYIGSDEAAVKEAYGEPDETKGSTLVYTSGGKHLEIGVTDGSVSSIVMRVVE